MTVLQPWAPGAEDRSLEAVAAAGGTAVGRLDWLRLRYGWGYRQHNLVNYDFASGRPVQDASRFLGTGWFLRRVQPLLNPPVARPVTENKWLFYRLADGFGLPLPRTIGLFDPVYGTTWCGERPLRTVQQVLDELADRRPRGLVLKPVGGGKGQGVVVLDEIDHTTGEALERTGRRTSLAGTMHALDLTGVRGYSGFILQELVQDHPEMRRIAPWTTNTVRVQTVVLDDGDVRVQAAVARFGRQGNMADNVSRGGISVGIDLATGALGRGRSWAAREWLDEHPDTGVDLVGVVLPFWKETLEVCRDAARRMVGLRAIGWDVAITTAGPVLLEGNAQWGLDLVQAHSDGFLADPVIRGQFEALGVPLPTGRFRDDLSGLVPHRLRKRLAR